MEAIIRTDYNGKKYLSALVWEQDEHIDYMIHGVLTYYRDGWEQEKVCLEELSKKHKERINKLMWSK